MNVVGSCPTCGAPIYQPSIGGGPDLPPVSYTCECRHAALAMRLVPYPVPYPTWRWVPPADLGRLTWDPWFDVGGTQIVCGGN